MWRVVETALEIELLSCLVHLLDEKEDVGVVLVIGGFGNVGGLSDGGTCKVIWPLDLRLFFSLFFGCLLFTTC